MEKDGKPDKRPKNEEEENMDELLLGLPYELILEILEHTTSSPGRGEDHQVALRQLKALRLVNREMNQVATDLLLDRYIKLLESVTEEIKTQVSGAWAGSLSEARAQRLTEMFEHVATAVQELGFLKDKVEEKKQARRAILQMPGIENSTKWQLLRACSVGSELLGLKGIASSLQKSKAELSALPSATGRVPLPTGPPDGRRPYGGGGSGGSGGAPLIFGEPDHDHMRIPDWERDRNPPVGPGYPGGDPFSPFGPGADPFSPFGPPRGGGPGYPGGDPFSPFGRGADPFSPFGPPRGGGPDPFNPRSSGHRGPRFL
jgi:hypothetical protein